MPSVRVRENEYFDAALRRFKRACEKAGVLTELRRREFYEKPTQERKRKKAAAVKRHQKRGMRDFSAPAPATTDPPSVTLKERITEDMKAAMRASEKERLLTIRMVQAAIKQREVDERIALDDMQVIAVLEKMVKQRASRSWRSSRAAVPTSRKRKAEIALLQAYLPAQLSDAEVDALIQEAIASTGASSMKDMGKVMGAVKAKAAGRADMGAVSARIKAALGG